jgi:hypothetical protein
MDAIIKVWTTKHMREHGGWWAHAGLDDIQNPLAVRGLEEDIRITLIIARIITFVFFTVLLHLKYIISKNF